VNLLKPEKPLRVNNHRYFRQSRYGTDKFVLVGQDRVHYIEAGQGEPVLLIPGSQSSFRVWRQLMPLLDPQYRLLELDYVDIEDNVNSAEKAARAVRQQSDWIAAMIDQLKLGKVNLIGARLGGAIAFNLAARFPDRVERVVGISAHIGVKIENSKNRPSGAGSTTPLDSLEEEARSIQCPILYLYGTRTNPRDIALAHNLEYLRINHPQAWIVALEGGIFEIALHNPREISALLLDFLKFKPGLRIG
jgi:pimeloyl-ACP methyl ester carboxylesterase